MIGNINISSLNVKTALCNIEVIDTYGCLGCSKRPYVIFQANSIKEPGIIPFESNCTFNKKYLSCMPEQYTLEIDTLNAYCYVYMEVINKTLYIDTNIEFVGFINPSNSQMAVSETSYEIAKTVFTDFDLLRATAYTMGGATILGMILSYVVKILQICFIGKGTQAVRDMHNENGNKK